MAKKKKSTAQKVLENMNKKTLFIVVLFLILGLAAGVLSVFVLTKNDTFELIGNGEISLNVGDEYIEESAKAVAFGKDVSDKIKIDGSVDTSTEGEYVIKYTVENFRFKGYTLYRKIVVGGNE